MITRWGVNLPEKGDLASLPRGVVLHWTAGSHWANDVDRAAYHYVVEADAFVRQGKHPVAANMRQLRSTDTYAQHTGGFNSFRVGLAGAGMKGYRNPRDVGPYPLQEVQVLRMLELSVYFLQLAELAISEDTLCTHREVWTLHGVKGQRNDQKLDIEYLDFRPDLEPDAVGPFLREWAREIAAEGVIPLPAYEPKVVERHPVVPMHLRTIERPTPEDFDLALAEFAIPQDAPADVVQQLVIRAVELVGRAVLRGERPDLKHFIDAAADWLKRRV